MSWQDYEYGPADDDYYSVDQLADAGVIWPDDLSQAMKDVMAERERQQCPILDGGEGWLPAHDDEHQFREMARAAACYARHAGQNKYERQRHQRCLPPGGWPWASSWWKPTEPRTDLIKAAALILAEIERLDRLAARSPAPAP